MMKDDYLNFLYWWLFGLGGGCALIILAVHSADHAGSYFAGVITIGFLLSMWHITIDIAFKATAPKLAWMGLLMLLRYALIGALIYVIIRVLGRKIAISWPWFVVGTTTLLPSLVFNDLFLRQKNRRNSS